MIPVAPVLSLVQILILGASAAGALWSMWRVLGKDRAVQKLIDTYDGGDVTTRAEVTKTLTSAAVADLATAAGKAAVADAGVPAEDLLNQLRERLALGEVTTPVDRPSSDTVPAASAFAAAGAGALALALTSSLANFSQRFHKDRLSCFTSSGGAVLDALRGGTGVAAGLLGMFASDQLGGLIETQVRPLLQDEVDLEQLPDVKNADDASRLALGLIRDRVHLAMLAHLTAVTAEAATPLKYLGVSQYAGLFADLAGFARIASALEGPVEFAAINQPMRLAANKRFRTTIPQPNDASFLYAKKELEPSELATYLAQSGYSEHLIEVIASAAFLDPRLSEIVRISQFFQPALIPELEKPTSQAISWWDDRPEWERRFAQEGITRDVLLGADWWFYYKLAKGGYEPTDVIVLTQVAKRATARREQSAFVSTATRLFREGFIAEASLRALIDEAWELSDPKAARLRVAELVAQAEELESLRDVTLRAMSHGVLSPERARELLVLAGLRPERADLEILRERLGLLPRRRVQPVESDAGLAEEVEAVA